MVDLQCEPVKQRSMAAFSVPEPVFAGGGTSQQAVSPCEHSEVTVQPCRLKILPRSATCGQSIFKPGLESALSELTQRDRILFCLTKVSPDYFSGIFLFYFI